MKAKQLEPGIASGADACPCDGCRYAPRCAAVQLSCSAFSAYVHGEPRSRWSVAPRVPSKSLLEALRAEREPGERKAKPPIVRLRPRAVVSFTVPG